MSLKNVRRRLKKVFKRFVSRTFTCPRIMKSHSKSYYIPHDSFDNALKQVEHFYHIGPISREKVRIDQVIKDKKLVSLVD